MRPSKAARYSDAFFSAVGRIASSGSLELKDFHRFATVDPSYAGFSSGDPAIIFDGENTLTLRTYKSTVAVSAGDRVIMLKINNSWVISGVIQNMG